MISESQFVSLEKLAIALVLEWRAASSCRTPGLLPDAELAEDSIKHIVGVDRADDVTEMIESLTQFDDHQIVAKSQHGRISRAMQSVAGGQQTVLTASRCHADPLPSTVRFRRQQFCQPSTQFIEATAIACADRRSLDGLVSAFGGLHGVVNAGVGEGSTVVVLGDGAVGVCAVQGAALRGASVVIHVGHHDDRLAIAAANGATHTINAKKDDPVEAIKALTGGYGADAVVETISSNASLARALEAVRDGGSVSVLGMSHFFEPVDQPYSAAFMRNLHLHPGVCPSRAYIPELLTALEQGKINPAVVLTHDLPLSDAARGFEIMDSRETGSIKVALTPGA